MREMQRIKRIVIQLLQGLPVIIITFLIGLFIARKAIQYGVPKYQSMAKIKLDDRKYGMSGNNLYEDFDVFSTENKIETEAELLKSPLLIGQTIDAMHLSVLVRRVGVIKTTILYDDNPLTFDYDQSVTNLLDEKFLLNVSGNSFTVQDEEESLLAEGIFGKAFELLGESLTISLNQELLSEKEITTDGTYEFEIKSKDAWISHIAGQLDVKAIDKEIPVLRVVMKSEDPQFSADFANRLCEVYVEDYIRTKSLAATKTLTFIDDRMQDLKTVLSQSENRLENYKIENEVVNTRQETETGLRELSKLNVQLINLEIEEEAIIALDATIGDGDYYEETAINFGFGDLLLTELVKKLKLYTDEKRDLLVKYTENDARVLNAQRKIDDIEVYIKEAIQQNKKDIKVKREELEGKIEILNGQFDQIPTREKEMRILERDFQINESVYTFLAQKKLEAQIASSALMSFHRIIQPAIVSKKPVSPNRVLITFVCGFLGLLAGILFVFAGKTVRGKILSKSDIEKLTAAPVVGVLKKSKEVSEIDREFITFSTSLKLATSSDKMTILVTSSTRKEGKSYVAMNLANTYARMGYKVAYIDGNPFNPTSQGAYDYLLENLQKQSDYNLNAREDRVCKIGLANGNANALLTLAHKNMPSVMAKIKETFDYVIIDTPGSVISIDAMCMLKYADLGLYIVRAKLSRVQYISNVDNIQADYGFNAMKIVLNGAHSSTNYSGNYNSSKLSYSELPKGIFGRVLHYFKTYSR